jgi:hypothetical protein
VFDVGRLVALGETLCRLRGLGDSRSPRKPFIDDVDDVPVEGSGADVVTIVVFVNGKEYGENLCECREKRGPIWLFM